MTDRELMQMALDGLCLVNESELWRTQREAAKALRDRLAQPELEPVAWGNKRGEFKVHQEADEVFKSTAIPFYTAPPKQPEPEPVAWLSKCYSDDNEDLGYNLWDIDVGEGCFPVYTTPPKREWVGFTHDELAWLDEALNLGGRLAVIEAIEDKLKRKNHGMD
jgi:hypothetical protein